MKKSSKLKQFEFIRDGKPIAVIKATKKPKARGILARRYFTGLIPDGIRCREVST